MAESRWLPGYHGDGVLGLTRLRCGWGQPTSGGLGLWG